MSYDAVKTPSSVKSLNYGQAHAVAVSAIASGCTKRHLLVASSSQKARTSGLN